MSWLRDALISLGWAVIAVALAAVASHAGWSGKTPLVLPLIAAPVLAYHMHRSKRIGWLTLGWSILCIAGIVLMFALALSNMRFRAIQG